MLYCKKLDERAILPTVAYQGEDLGYDVYALENTVLEKNIVTKVQTGIAARFIDDNARYKTLGGNGPKIEDIFGLLLRDRSSMAAKGITVSGGVIDSGYTGELLVMLTNNSGTHYPIKQGEKIAQMIPLKVYTINGVLEISELPESSRGLDGFGSSGK